MQASHTHRFAAIWRFLCIHRWLPEVAAHALDMPCRCKRDNRLAMMAA
jgi:hypothetical protein